MNFKDCSGCTFLVALSVEPLPSLCAGASEEVASGETFASFGSWVAADGETVSAPLGWDESSFTESDVFADGATDGTADESADGATDGITSGSASDVANAVLVANNARHSSTDNSLDMYFIVLTPPNYYNQCNYIARFVTCQIFFIQKIRFFPNKAPCLCDGMTKIC